MAASLEDRLRPDEQVLHRTPRPVVPLGLLITACSLVFVVPGLHWLGVPLLAEGGTHLLLLLLGFYLVLFYAGMEDFRDKRSIQAVVTGSRALHRAGRGDAGITEVPLEEVAGVEVFRHKVRIAKKTGEAVELALPKGAGGLGQALARASGAPAPQPLPRREGRADWVVTGLSCLSAAAAAVGFVIWQQVSFAADLDSGLMAYVHISGLCAVTTLIGYAGSVLGRLLGLALLKPFFTGDQIERWLSGTTAVSIDPDEDSFARVYLGLVRLLYGERPGSRDVRLEDLLEHRECIVYRAPRRLEPHDWFVEVSFYGLGIAIVAAVGLLDRQPASLAALGAALAGPVAHWLYCIVRDWSREAVLTDRRLLHRTGWLKPEITEVRLNDIRHVRAAREKLRITRHAARQVDVGHPHACLRLGAELSRAAGLTPQRAATQREALANYLLTTGALTLSIVAAVVPLKWLYSGFADLAATYGWLVPGAGFLLLGWLAGAIGICLGFVLMPALFRPFFSREEMAAWLANNVAFWPEPLAPDEVGDPAEPESRLVTLLYGSRKSPPAR